MKLAELIAALQNVEIHDVDVKVIDEDGKLVDVTDVSVLSIHKRGECKRAVVLEYR